MCNIAVFATGQGVDWEDPHQSFRQGYGVQVAIAIRSVWCLLACGLSLAFTWRIDRDRRLAWLCPAPHMQGAEEDSNLKAVQHAHHARTGTQPNVDPEDPCADIA